jgi:hypothetical protein
VKKAILIHILKHFAGYPLINSTLMDQVIEAQSQYELKNKRKSKGLQVLIVRFGTEEHNLRALKKSRGTIESIVRKNEEFAGSQTRKTINKKSPIVSSRRMVENKGRMPPILNSFTNSKDSERDSLLNGTIHTTMVQKNKNFSSMDNSPMARNKDRIRVPNTEMKKPRKVDSLYHKFSENVHNNVHLVGTPEKSYYKAPTIFSSFNDSDTGISSFIDQQMSQIK